MGAGGAAVDFGRPQGVRREHPRSGAVTDEQRRGRAKDPPLGSIFFSTGLPCLVFILIRFTPLRAFMRWFLVFGFRFQREAREGVLPAFLFAAGRANFFEHLFRELSKCQML